MIGVIPAPVRELILVTVSLEISSHFIVAWRFTIVLELIEDSYYVKVMIGKRDSGPGGSFCVYHMISWVGVGQQ